MHDGSPLHIALQHALSDAGDASPIESIRPVGGGDINQAACVTTSEARYFVKWHRNPPPRFFTCEAAGLAALGAPGVIRVPEVIASGLVPGETTAFLILGWIEPGRGRSGVADAMGRQLAALHQTEGNAYGFTMDNYIGRLPQPNPSSDSWVAFYRDQRLGAQRDQAAQNGRLPRERARRLQSLMDNLAKWIDGTQSRPSLLHGDLWGGNWMTDSDGHPVLIDPATYYGDREADIAMTALFGGFPQRFYDAYHEAYPLPPGWRERQDLYQLYYLLCHLNLFGEGYGGSVDAILRRYA